jgi:histidinol phosphatase-like PHP family hydrolase
LLAKEMKAKLVVNTDAHSTEDLSSMAFSNTVARGAGMLPEDIRAALVSAPEEILKRLGRL